MSERPDSASFDPSANFEQGGMNSNLELGNISAKMEAVTLITSKADEISRLVTNEEESKKVFDAIIALSDSILLPKNTTGKKTQED